MKDKIVKVIEDQIGFLTKLETMICFGLSTSDNKALLNEEIDRLESELTALKSEKPSDWKCHCGEASTGSTQIWACNICGMEIYPPPKIQSEPRSKEDMGDDLCKYCPLDKRGVYGVDGGFVAGCEGSKCDQAYELYIDSLQSEPRGETAKEAELREPIENALYATGRFLAEECSELTDGILMYIGDYFAAMEEYKNTDLRREWISVKDKLPPKDENVLCWNGFEFMVANWTDKTGTPWFKRTFTHWMKLPSVPNN